jgi:hypothetical protein
MFPTQQPPPDQIATLMIEEYISNIRGICQKDELSKREEDYIMQSGHVVMKSLITSILNMVPEDKQAAVLNRMHLRFVDVLLDYDRQWIWDLFTEFSGQLPENMLN